MHIEQVSCPRCATRFIVDGRLWEIGTVALRCPACSQRFVPAESPQTRTVESATNASVPVTIWEPSESASERAPGTATGQGVQE